MDDLRSGREAMGLRGTIALDQVACTSCLVCIRDCPTKCMSLTSHVEERQGAGRRPTKINILDAFEIDFGLCMYCGICVDVCPHEALFWSPAPTANESGDGARERLIYSIEGLAESLVGVIRPVVSGNS